MQVSVWITELVVSFSVSVVIALVSTGLDWGPVVIRASSGWGSLSVAISLVDATIWVAILLVLVIVLATVVLSVVVAGLDWGPVVIGACSGWGSLSVAISLVDATIGVAC